MLLNLKIHKTQIFITQKIKHISNLLLDKLYRDRNNTIIFNIIAIKPLEKYQINVTIRREMGSDIDGACGQLRRRYVETK